MMAVFNEQGFLLFGQDPYQQKRTEMVSQFIEDCRREESKGVTGNP